MKNKTMLKVLGDMKKVICLIVLLSVINFIFAQTQYFQNFQEKKPGNNGVKYLGGFLGQGIIGVPLAITTILVVSLIPDVSTTRNEISIDLHGLDLLPTISSTTTTSNEPGTFETILLVLLTPAAFTYGTAFSTYQVGKWQQDEGTINGAFWGGGIGYLSGLLIGGGAALLIKNAYPVLLSVLTGPAGSVIGYNLSRNSNSSDDFGLHNPHFGLPSIGLKSEKTDDGKTMTALDFRLINARF